MNRIDMQVAEVNATLTAMMEKSPARTRFAIRVPEEVTLATVSHGGLQRFLTPALARQVNMEASMKLVAVVLSSCIEAAYRAGMMDDGSLQTILAEDTPGQSGDVDAARREIMASLETTGGLDGITTKYGFETILAALRDLDPYLGKLALPDLQQQVMRALRSAVRDDDGGDGDGKV